MDYRNLPPMGSDVILYMSTGDITIARRVLPGRLFNNMCHFVATRDVGSSMATFIQNPVAWARIPNNGDTFVVCNLKIVLEEKDREMFLACRHNRKQLKSMVRMIRHIGRMPKLIWNEFNFSTVMMDFGTMTVGIEPDGFAHS